MMRISRGEMIMKYLKIDNGSAYYLSSDSEYIVIEEITKEDLMKLINLAVDESCCFEMDDYEEVEILNPAHKIIYSNLYRKLVGLVNDGNRFRDESNTLYMDAKIKYGID